MIAEAAGDPADPWAVGDGWRMNGTATASIALEHDGVAAVIEARAAGRAWTLETPGGSVTAHLADGVLHADGARIRAAIVRDGAAITVIEDGASHAFTLTDPLAPPPGDAAADTRLVAPTPARVGSVFVQAGDVVRRGDKLLILEAMKVETTFTAPRDGIIETVHVEPDALIAEGAQLITFVALADDAA